MRTVGLWWLLAIPVGLCAQGSCLSYSIKVLDFPQPGVDTSIDATRRSACVTVGQKLYFESGEQSQCVFALNLLKLFGVEDAALV
jgi:hypothetical protein